MEHQSNGESANWPNRIDLVVFDFDGVMTDNTVIVSETGIESVRCHRGDGLGIARVREAGIAMLVISLEANAVVSARCAKLELPCYQGINDKAEFLSEFLQENGIPFENVVYIGNDINDLGCLRMVGFPVAVADAEPPVIGAAKLVLARKGGKGAVREFCDRLLAYLAKHREAAT